MPPTSQSLRSCFHRHTTILKSCAYRSLNPSRNRLQMLHQLRNFAKSPYGKYATYEKPAVPRLRVNQHFYGWKKWLVLAYHLGFFKLVKWGIIGYISYRYWHYVWPVLKYGSLATCGVFLSLFWLRCIVYRKFGAALYDRYTLKLCRTRFERIFQAHDQLRAVPLLWLIHKTWFKCMLLRSHRPWLHSLQQFLSGYQPFTYYTSEKMSHGIAFQPLLIEHDGYYKAFFTWFIDREELMNTYGWVEIECDGNFATRTMNVREFRLHVNPKEGGEVLKFKPFKLSMDEDWKASMMEHAFNDTAEDETQTNAKQRLKNKPPPSSMRRKKKQTAVVDADYEIK